MKYYISTILIIVSFILAFGGSIAVIGGLIDYMPAFWGGLCALFSSAFLYGFAYIVKASVIYCEKFKAEVEENK